MSSKKYDLGLQFYRIGPPMKKILGIKDDIELAQFLDIPPQSINTYKKGRYRNHDVPPSWIAKFQMKTKHTLDDLLKGGQEGSEKGDGGSKEKSPGSDIVIRYANNVQIVGGDLEEVMIELAKKWIEDYFRENKRDLIAWIMDADNMRGPNIDSIERNALILIDTGVKTVRGSGVYAFTAAGEITVRRVLKTVHGGIDLLNDNPAYASLPMMRHASLDTQMEILGRVVFIGRII